jgi:hypothetical protein
LFTVKEVGGFVLQGTGKGQVLVKNQSITRYLGMVSLIERRFIHQYKLQALKSWSPAQIGTGVIIGAAASIGILKYLK